jgi:transcriptional regulator with XRE-family HTH domain
MRYAGYDAVRLAGELTELLGRRVEERTVEAWLRGERTPTMERLSQIAQILGRKEVYFLADRPRSREKNFAVSK